LAPMATVAMVRAKAAVPMNFILNN
jgi:hypothetical protein